jgi:hypothetical protein
MRGISGRLLAAVVLAIGVGPLTAYAQNSASLVGKVMDASSAVMPGVTVTATSPALQVPQMTTTTDTDGTYRIVQLPVGVYTVKFELQGFQSYVQTDIRLTVGFAGRVDAVMKVGTVSESVTVTGASPVVDTVNTTSSTTFQHEVLQSTPKGQGMWQIYALASGVKISGAPDVGDSQVGSRGSIEVYGVAQQATININGINAVTFDGDGSSSATYVNGFPFEEIKVTSSGANPEFGPPGAAVQAEMKSGANSFHGTYQGAFETPGMQSNNITPTLQAQGLQVTTPLDHYHDFAGDLGGRIIRDKLWFYGGLSNQSQGIGVPGFAQSPGPDGVYLTADDVPAIQSYTLHDYFGKVSAQPWRSTNLNFSDLKWLKLADGWGGSRLVPYPSARYEPLAGYDWKAGATIVPSSNMLIDAYTGFADYTDYEDFEPGANNVAGNPSRKEISTGLQTGPRTSPYQGGEFNYESHATVTFLPKREILGGRHEVKTGLIFTINFTGAAYPSKPSGNYVLQDLNGQPNSIVLYNWPIDPRSDNDQRGQALFLTDTWRANRLTMNLGVRWERYRNFYPTQTRQGGPFAPYFGAAQTFQGQDVLLWKRIVPRLGVNWDIVGNGKTVLKATFGEYSNQPGLTFASTFNPYAQGSATYLWHDLNGNRDYDPGEVDLDPTHSDFISASGGKSQLLNPNLQQPHEFEFMTELDRELVNNTAVRLIYVRKEMLQLFDSAARNVGRPIDYYTVPVSVKDPGPDGVAATADDGGPMTLYTYPAQYSGSAFGQNMFVNAPSDRPNIYNTIEGTFEKRYSNRWNLLTSFGVTKSHEWLIAAAVPQTPNDTLFPLNDTWKWNGRATGSYKLPYDIQVSATLLANSGAPYGRTVTFGRIPQLNTVTVRVEPVGAERLPTFAMANFAVNKSVPVGSKRLSVIFNVYNAFNTSAPTAATFLSGAAYGYATQVLAPRILRLGARFTF